MRVQISLRDPDFNSFWYVPRSGIAGPYGSSTLSFWGNSLLFSIAAETFYIPKSTQGFQFLHILTQCLFKMCNSHPNRCEVIFHCSLDLHFPDNNVKHLFAYLLVIYISLEKCLFKSFAHFSIGLFGGFFAINLDEFLTYLGNQLLTR